MKRATKVNKTDSGEQEPYSRQLTMARKENARLKVECAERIVAMERKADEKIDAACAERDTAIKAREGAVRRLEAHQDLYRDFARIAPVLRAKSILKRLWWGVRFGLWGVFGYEATPVQDSVETLKDRLHTIFRSAEAAGITLGDDPDCSVCQSFGRVHV